MHALRSVPLLFSLALSACGGAAESNLLQPGPPGNADGGHTSDSSTGDVHTMGDVMHKPDVAPADVNPPMDTNPPPPDTGPPDTGPARPPLTCGTSSCTVPDDICCAHTTGYTPTYDCQPASEYKTCASGGGTPIFCGSPEDCPGQICCGTKTFSGSSQYAYVACASTCDSTNNTKITFCDPTSPTDVCAPLGGYCAPSTILDGYDVCN